MKKSSMYVGMDVHKDSIDVAIADDGRTGEVRHYGHIDGSRAALDKVVRKLQSTGRRLHFVYEAGSCGDVIYRHLTAKGFTCAVVAPSNDPITIAVPEGRQVSPLKAVSAKATSVIMLANPVSLNDGSLEYSVML